ncbi:hypothetical protein SLA2020_397770 [Shorea laevis]
METKLAGDRAAEVARSLGLPKWVLVDADGYAGGIWVLWDDSRFSVDILSKGPQVIHALVKVCSHPYFANFNWYLSAVYARPQFEIRCKLWDNLREFSQIINGPWLVIGDFNDITTQSEKFGGNPCPSYRIQTYTDCMSFCNLLDLGFNGPKFTWVNKRNSNHLIRERLDRAWGNPPWKINFPEATIYHLPRLSSDHCPILLSLNPTVPFLRNKPFRLEKFWLEHESFKELVVAEWTFFERSVSECSTQFRSSVRLWSKTTFDNIHKKKREILARVAGIQRFLQSRNSSFLLQLEKNLTQEYQHLLKCEEDLWFLKSRSQWIQEGDRNTRFFHISTIRRRSYNRIMGLKDPHGTWCYEPIGIQATVLSYFKDLYTTSHSYSFHDSFMGITEAPIIEHSKWDSLMSPPTDAEILATIKSMKAWKAPGPDGLHAAFFQKFWELINPKLCPEIRMVFDNANIPDSWNRSFIALIPKIPNPEMVSQFRPIGLCNVVYKVVTKIIVSRMRNFIDNLISPLQSSFIPGRNGMDNVLILRDLVHSFTKRKGREGDMIVKLDLEKAYDRLEWGFIREALLFFNFPPRFKVVLALIVGRGLSWGRKGRSCPIYSLLMILFSLVKPASQTLLSLERCWIFSVKDPGEKVNLEKSKILFSCNTQATTKREVCNILKISETDYLGKYLGIPITPKRISKVDCNFIIDKVRTKLSGWKANMLSLAGRITLVSSVLSSIPNYYMQGTFFPAATHRELDSISRQFLWGSTKEQRKANLVSWDRITQPKKFGGLGLRSSKEANQAAMAKVHWRLLTDKDKIWARAFRDKYGIKSPNSSLQKPSPVLRDISRGKHIMDKGVRWIPRDGDSISFWQDTWVGDAPLNSVVYGPFQHDTFRVSVKDALLPFGQWDWNLISYSLLEDIMSRIKAIPLQISSADRDAFIWGYSSNGVFKTKSAYLLAKNISPHNDCSWSWIWKIHTLPRIQTFLWLLRHGRLLTLEALLSWGVVGSSSCPRCHQAPETINHIFRECFFSKILWAILTPYPINTLFHNLDFKGWLYAHATLSDTSNHLKWNTIFSFIIWSLWYFRNQLVHEGKNYSIAMARDFILAKIKDFDQAHCISHKPKASVTILVGWSPPPPGFIKLNTDGSALTNPGTAGARGVFRNESGNWLLGYYRNIGFTSSLSAELWALRDGLKLAVQRGFSNLLIETDSKVAKILLDSANSNFHSLGVLIADCRAMMSQIPDLQLNHILREANAVADGLAKKGAKSESHFVVLDHCPTDLCYLLLSDCMGTMFPRNSVTQ